MILGQHLLIECQGEHASLDAEGLNTLMTRAAKAAGATVLHQHFHQFGGHGGITGVLILAESHITVHTWPENDYAAFDIFMCGDAQPMLAARIISDQFPAAQVCIRSADRGQPGDVDAQFKLVQTHSNASPGVESSALGDASTIQSFGRS